MKIPECSRVGAPPPSLNGIIESLEGIIASSTQAGVKENADESLSRFVFLLSAYMDTNFDEPTSLQLWVNILNMIDSAMGTIINESGKYLLLGATRDSWIAPPADFEGRVEVHRLSLVVMLRFTIKILTYGTNKDVYNSVEHVLQLLRAYDDELSSLALETLERLITPPSSQRSLQYHNHTTVMHKKGSLATPVFQVVEAAHKALPFRVQHITSDAFELPSEARDLNFDLSNWSRHAMGVSLAGSNTSPRPEVATSGHKRLRVANITEDARDMLSLLNAETDLEAEHAFSFMWQVRVQRKLGNLQGRYAALRILYQSVVVLLSGYPNSDVLSEFFVDKADLIADFIYLLKTGPGAVDYDSRIPFDIRAMAVQNIIAVVVSRDASAVSVMGRFSWIQQDLGITRGQYMGLLPCLLRSSVSFLRSRDDSIYMEGAVPSTASTFMGRLRKIESGGRDESVDFMNNTRAFRGIMLDSNSWDKERLIGSDAIATETRNVTAETVKNWISAVYTPMRVSSQNGAKQYNLEYVTRLLWIEHVFIFTTAIIAATTALPALVDSGFLSLVVSLIGDMNTRDSNDIMLSYVVGTATQIMDQAISESSATMGLFRDMAGIDVILERLLHEINDDRLYFETPPLSEESSSSSSSSSSGEAAGSKRKLSVGSDDRVGKLMRVDGSAGAPVQSATDASSRFVRGTYTLSPATSVLIHSLMNISCNYFHDSSDPRLGQLIRGKTINNIFAILTRNAQILRTQILDLAYSLLSDVINNDPGYLTYVLSNGVVRFAFESFMKIMENITFKFHPEAERRFTPAENCLASDYPPELTNELIVAVWSLISTVCLTKEGLEFVKSTNPFGSLFDVFFDYRLYAPASYVMMNDLAMGLGTNIEEVIRHYPDLAEPCVSAMCKTLDRMVSVALSTDVSTFEQLTHFGVSYAQHIHALVAIMRCMVKVLERTGVPAILLNLDIMRTLCKVVDVGTKPVKSFLCAAAASTEPSANSLGYFPLMKLLDEMILLLAVSDSKAVLEAMVSELASVKPRVSDAIRAYWSHCIVGSPPKSLDDVNVRMDGFLDSIPRLRMNKCVQENGQLPKGLSLYADVLRSFVHMSHLINRTAAVLHQVGSLKGNPYSSIDKDSPNNILAVFSELIHDCFIPTQIELGRARGTIVCEPPETSRQRVSYRVMLITFDHIILRPSPQDNTRRSGRLPRGGIVTATERCIGGDNGFRYHVQDDWVSQFKNSFLGDPQVEIIDIMDPDEDNRIVPSELLNTTQKRFEFDKVSDVSPRRAGFMAIFQMHGCFKNMMSVLSRYVIPAASSPNNTTCKYALSTLLYSMNNLLPNINIVPSKRPWSAVVDDVSLAGPFDSFYEHEIPTLEQFGISDCFRIVHAIDVFLGVLRFDQPKDGPMIVLISHMLANGMFERLIHASVLVFLCSLTPEPATPTSKRMFDLEEFQEDISTPEAAKLRHLQERHMVALSSMDLVVELWDGLMSKLTVTSALATALTPLVDSTHQIDFYKSKRQMMFTMLSYMYQLIRHPLLATLPSENLKNIFNFLFMTQRSLIDAHSSASMDQTLERMFPRTGSASTAEESKSTDGSSSSNTADSTAMEVVENQPEIASGSRRRSTRAKASSKAADKSVEKAAAPIASIDEKAVESDVAAISSYPIRPLSHFLPANLSTGARLPEAEMQRTESTISVFYRALESVISDVCITLIGRGPNAPIVPWRPNSSQSNRVDFTLMVLSAMNKLMTKPICPEPLFNLSQALIVQDPILDILKESRVDDAGATKLNGLLSALVLQLTCKGIEFILLATSTHPDRKEIFDLLIDNIQSKVISIRESSSPDSFSKALESEDCLWLNPALALIDTYAQPLVVDPTVMKENFDELVTAREVQKIKNAKGKTALSMSMSHPQNIIFSTTFTDSIRADFNSKYSKPTDKPDQESELSMAFPLIDDLLSFETRKKCLKVCVDLLQLMGASKSKELSSLCRAAVQLICHLTRDRQLAEYFMEIDGFEITMNCKVKVDNSPSLIYTLIMHMLEDETHLQASMEWMIKLCYHRMTLNSKNVPVKQFFEVMAPLVFRSQRIFFKAFKAGMKISDDNCILPLENTSSSSSSKVSEASSTKEKHSDARSASKPVKSESSSSSSMLAPYSASSPHTATMKRVLEVLGDKLLSQWLARVRFTQVCEDEWDQNEPYFILTMFDTLTIMGDLVCSVPGFATCVHSYMYTVTAKKTPRHEVLEATLAEQKHCITGEMLHSTNFITFLVHYLLQCDVKLAIPQSLATKPSEHILSESDFKAFKEAVYYLLAALAAKPGEGRRRVLKEILGALRISGCSLDSTSQLKAVSSVTSCIQAILNPRPAWRQRSMLTIPHKDMVVALYALKSHCILSEALSSISMDHPMALQVSELIAAPLDFLIRRGVVMYEEENPPKQSQESKDASKEETKSVLQTPARRLSRVHRASRADLASESLTPAQGNGESEATGQTPAVVSAPAPVETPNAHDFFSPLVSRSIPHGLRRDTITTTDDDRDDGRTIENLDTFESELRLLEQPGRSMHNSGDDDMSEEDIDHDIYDEEDDDDMDEHGDDDDDDIIIDEMEEVEEGDETDEGDDEDEEDEDDDSAMIEDEEEEDMDRLDEGEEMDDEHDDEEEDEEEIDEDEDDEEGSDFDDENGDEMEMEEDESHGDFTQELDGSHPIISASGNTLPPLPFNVSELIQRMHDHHRHAHGGSNGEANPRVEVTVSFRLPGQSGDGTVQLPSELINTANAASSHSRSSQSSRRAHHSRSHEEDEDAVAEFDDFDEDSYHSEADFGVHNREESERNPYDISDGDFFANDAIDAVDVDDSFDIAMDEEETEQPEGGMGNGRRGRDRTSSMFFNNRNLDGEGSDVESLLDSRERSGMAASRRGGVRLSDMLGSFHGDPQHVGQNFMRFLGGMIHNEEHEPIADAARRIGSEAARLDHWGSRGGGEGVDVMRYLNHRGRESGSSTAPTVTHHHPLMAAAINSHTAERRSSSRARAASHAAGPGRFSILDAIVEAIEGQASNPLSVRTYGIVGSGIVGSHDDVSHARAVAATRRRLLGSLISDRRWGLETGDRDLGAHLNTLVSRVASALDVDIGRERSRSRGRSFDHTASSSSGNSFLQRMFGLSMPPRRILRTSGSADEETKEETEVQESKDDDEAPATSANRRSLPRSDNFILWSSDLENGELPSPAELFAMAEAATLSSTAATQEPASASASASSTTAPVGLYRGPSSGSLSAMPQAEENQEEEEDTSESDSSLEEESGEETNANAVSGDAPSALQCPDGFDASVWASLPREVQQEYLQSQETVEAESSAYMETTELDRSVLEELPPAVRMEVLREEVVERRRRESVDLSDSAAPVEPSATEAGGPLVASFGSAIGADLQDVGTSRTSNTSSAGVHENVTFIMSLPEDLRQEALLGADDAFIATLTPALQTQANALRSRNRHLVATAFGPSRNRQPASQSSSSSQSSAAVDTPARASSSPAVPGTAESSTSPASGGAPSTSQSAAPVHPTTAFVTGDRANVPPFGARLVARLVRHLVLGVSPKASRAINRLVGTVCKYKSVRSTLLHALVYTAILNGDSMKQCLECIPKEPYKTYNFKRTGDGSTSSVGDVNLKLEIESMQKAIEKMDASHAAICSQRILHTLIVLTSRSDRLVWFDLMSKQNGQNGPICVRSWLFEQIIDMLKPSAVLDNGIDSVLFLLEELCEPFALLTPTQANELVERQKAAAQEVTVGESTLSLVRPRDGLQSPSTDQPAKKRKLETGSVSINSDVNTTDAAVPAAADTAIVPISDESAKINKDAPSADKKYPDLPFPLLADSSIDILKLISKGEYGGASNKSRVSRILSTLSLCDSNWHRLVACLASAAQELLSSTVSECQSILQVLSKVRAMNRNAEFAVSLPELSTPSAVAETKLLRVFRLMGSLRQPNNPNSKANTEATPMTLSGSREDKEFVAEYLRNIEFGDLWDCLCKILDGIRALEGIVDETVHVSASSSSKGSSAKSSTGTPVSAQKKQPVLTSLTMRFMPLIECYLTVSGATLLRPKHSLPDGQTPSGAHSAEDGHFFSLPSSSSTCSLATMGGAQQSSALAASKSYVPGLRFRKHAAFLDMQMDVIEGPEANRFVHFADSNKTLLNLILRQNVPLLETTFSPLVLIPRCRSLLHFDIKRQYFKLKLKKLKQSSGRSYGSLRIVARRSSVMEDSFQKLRFCSADEMRRRLNVTFHGEEGIDAGGLTREWFSLLAKEIFNVNYCLFTATHDNVTFQPNPYSGINPDHLDYFKFVGRIIGKALSDGHLLDAHFTRSFYKHMLGIPVGYQDLEALEPEYYKSLMSILEHPLDLLGLDLTFSAELNEFGRVEVVDLIENGRLIAVTDENKLDYVRLVANHRMTTAIKKQIDAFLEGFHELIPPELISIFDAQELELIISGLPDIDLDDLRAHTDYNGYKASDPAINYLWAVLRSFSPEEKALFLQFVTGTSKVPLDGFQALHGARGPQQFNVHKAYGGTHLLPSAHTCFNQLDLPEYTSEDELREKLLIAIREGSEGFGFA